MFKNCLLIYYGNGKPKEFNTYEEAKSYLDNVKTLKNIDEDTSIKKTTDDKKQTIAEINKEKDEYVYKAEDFQPKASPDVVEEALKNQEKDYADITKFWDWLSSEKELNNWFKQKKDKVAKVPPGLR